MRMSVSILTPKAFSIRSALVLDKSEWPLRNDDNVGRDTPSAAAAAPTASPRGSITSVLTNAPGCGGLSIRMQW